MQCNHKAAGINASPMSVIKRTDIFNFKCSRTFFGHPASTLYPQNLLLVRPLFNGERGDRRLREKHEFVIGSEAELMVSPDCPDSPRAPTTLSARGQTRGFKMSDRILGQLRDGIRGLKVSCPGI